MTSTSAADTSQPPSSVDPRRAHLHAIKTGNTDLSTLNKLITAYARSNFTADSLRLFYRISSPNVVTWTSIISAVSSHFLSLHLFVSMLRHPILPNSRTLSTLFKSCASLPSISFGLQLHSLSIKLSLSSHPFSGSSLVNFYAKARFPDEARKAFDEITQRDDVCFAAIIVGLAQNSRSVDALTYFSNMRTCGVQSTVCSVSGALRAASELAALEQCRVIHGHSVVTGFNLNIVVGTAMVDGYGKCGLVAEARALFDELICEMNVVGWNAIMSSYAQQGDYSSVVKLFGSMEEKGLQPDEYSFLAVLTASCNANLVKETEEWLSMMGYKYSLEPSIEHYTCLVGALGRSGRLEDAERCAMAMPFEADAVVWLSLLSACAQHGNADMAWKMSARLLEIDPFHDSAYVIAANVFASAARWDEVMEIRKMMKGRRVRKKGGQSWIEVKGKVHLFHSGDRGHERTEEIHTKLVELFEETKKLGYVPCLDEVLRDIGESEKKELLMYHSEKLAVAFGLVSGTPQGKPLRIVKNLRICRDCHEFFKYISKLMEREIIVRDVNRYHRFFDGNCSCGGHW